MLTVGTTSSETVTSEQTTMPTFTTDVTTGRFYGIICLFVHDNEIVTLFILYTSYDIIHKI